MHFVGSMSLRCKVRGGASCLEASPKRAPGCSFSKPTVSSTHNDLIPLVLRSPEARRKFTSKVVIVICSGEGAVFASSREQLQGWSYRSRWWIS